MHYKNGREAKNGDPVIAKGYHNQPVAGVIYDLTAGSETCNCSVAVVIPGGVGHLTCRTVGDYYHAEDAFQAINESLPLVNAQLSVAIEELAAIKDATAKNLPVPAEPAPGEKVTADEVEPKQD